MASVKVVLALSLFLVLFANVSAAIASCAATEAIFESCDPNSSNFIDCFCKTATPSEVAQCILDGGNADIPLYDYKSLFALCDVYANVSPAAATSLLHQPVSVVLATFSSIVNALPTGASTAGITTSAPLTTSSILSFGSSIPTTMMSVTSSSASSTVPTTSSSSSTSSAASSTPTSFQVVNSASALSIGLQLHFLLLFVVGLIL